LRTRIRAGVRESRRTDAGDGDRGRPAPPRRGAVYVDEAIWEWRGLKWAHLLADGTDDLHRFAAALGIHRTSYQGPPRTSVPHYDLTSYERRRAIAHGAIACCRDEIVAVVRWLPSPCAVRGGETGSYRTFPHGSDFFLSGILSSAALYAFSASAAFCFCSAVCCSDPECLPPFPRIWASAGAVDIALLASATMLARAMTTVLIPVPQNGRTPHRRRW